MRPREAASFFACVALALPSVGDTVNNMFDAVTPTVNKPFENTT